MVKNNLKTVGERFAGFGAQGEAKPAADRLKLGANLKGGLNNETG